MHLLICNQLVNGARDAMLCAVCNFFVISHLLSVNMNEWIEAIATEAEWGSDWHVRLGHLGQYSGDEEDFKREVLPDNISWYISILESCACAWVRFFAYKGFHGWDFEPDFDVYFDSYFHIFKINFSKSRFDFKSMQKQPPTCFCIDFHFHLTFFYRWAIIPELCNY